MGNKSFEHYFIMFTICILVIAIILAVAYFISKGRLKIIGTNKFKVKGKFRSIDFEKGIFQFISIEGQEYTGLFDKLVRKGLEKIDLMGVYEISISRIIEKQYDSQDVRITDTIIAYEEER